MIIIAKHTNQLCNRLFTYLPIVSYALEAGEKVKILYQYEGYRGFFPNLEHGDVVSTGSYTKSQKGGIRSNVTYAVASAIDKVVHLILKPGEPIPLRKPLGVLIGAKYRIIRNDAAYVEKHRDKLRQIFAPPADVASSIESDFAKVAAEDTVIVGVHMRRGDYAQYQGGKYYYTDDVYVRHMQNMVDQLGGRKVVFLLCSNERINMENFSQFSTFRTSGGSMLHDLYALAKCQYVIGAPSTFSHWASFYGGVPIFHIRKPEVLAKLSDFAITKSPADC